MVEATSLPFKFSEEQVKHYHRGPMDHSEILARLLKNCCCHEVKSLLDVGCGDGKLTSCLSKMFPQASILGCDVSPTMIEFAAKQYASPQLQFVKMHAERLAFEQQFDLVVSFNCLHWIKNQKKVFEQIFKVLKPGGRAFLIACPQSSRNDFKLICKRVICSLRWLFYFLSFRSCHSFQTKDEYRHMLVKQGKVDGRGVVHLVFDQIELCASKPSSST